LEEVLPSQCSPKTGRVTILTSNKVDFKLSLDKRDKEGHFILVKGAIHQKEITNINLYTPNVSAPNFIRHTLQDLKAHIDFSIVAVRDFSTPLSPIDTSCKQKNKKEILELNDTVHKMDLADAYYIFHPTEAQYTFFSVAHGTFSKIDHTLGPKARLSKYKKIEITPCIPPDHKAIKLEFNNKNNSRQYTSGS
jgi:exonuclease III